MAGIQIKRGTRAQLEAAAAGAELKPGEQYLITDERRQAVGLSASTYAASMREDQVVVSSTAPPEPFLNQIWIEI